MCVASNTPEFYLLLREFPRLLARYDEGWHTRDDLIRAQQPRDSAKQAPPGLRGSPVVPADTCDDDLGDIQNGAKGRRFTVASFILSGCCENTYTHTHAHIAANTNKHADADWDRLGQRPLLPHIPSSPLPGLETLAAYMQSLQCTCKRQHAHRHSRREAAQPSSAAAAWHFSAMNRNNRHSAPKLFG